MVAKLEDCSGFLCVHQLQTHTSVYEGADQSYGYAPWRSHRNSSHGCVQSPIPMVRQEFINPHVKTVKKQNFHVF